jgi:hypothetical protein
VRYQTEHRVQPVLALAPHQQKEIAMPTGASPKREREYKEIESKFKKEGRYPGREEEVAARIVNKQRAEHGETKSKSSKAK